MVNKKKVLSVASVVLASALAIGGTLAYLQDTSEERINEFEKSTISVDLTETQNGPYKIVPGESAAKNPTVIANTPDVDAYVFLEVKDETDGLVNYAIEGGWTKLEGEDNIYYREAAAKDGNYEFQVLQGDKVSYSPSITADDMGDLDVNAKLTFKSYIIQKSPFNSARKAWDALNPVTTEAELLDKLANGGYAALGEDISLTQPITIDKEAVLDLNGHTLSSDQPTMISITPQGDLTITGDGSIIGPANGATYDSNALITVDAGKLKMESGTVTATGAGSDGMYGVYVLNGGEATFGKADGTGPAITSHFAAIGTNNTTAPAKITVLGGSYRAEASPAASDWWSYFCAPIYAAANGEYNIRGGSFSGYYGLISSRYADTDQDIAIDNAVRSNGASGTDIFVDSKKGSTNTPDRHITAGSNSMTLPAGYQWVDNGGSYEVATA